MKAFELNLEGKGDKKKRLENLWKVKPHILPDTQQQLIHKVTN